MTGTVYRLREIDIESLHDHSIWTGSRQRFLEGATPFVIAYTRARLARDADLVGDFYVHFCERVELCMELYRERQHIPVRAFLATFLRHEFMNFIRKRRRRTLKEERHRAPVYDRDAGGLPGLITLQRSLRKLDENDRLLVKLQYGLDPELDDLKVLVSLAGGPLAIDTLRRFRERKLACNDRARRLQDRASYLGQLLGRGGSPEQAQNWRRWKTRIARSLRRDGGLFTFAELEEIFGIGRSSVWRRLARALQILKETER